MCVCHCSLWLYNNVHIVTQKQRQKKEELQPFRKRTIVVAFLTFSYILAHTHIDTHTFYTLILFATLQYFRFESFFRESTVYWRCHHSTSFIVWSICSPRFYSSHMQQCLIHILNCLKRRWPAKQKRSCRSKNEVRRQKVNAFKRTVYSNWEWCAYEKSIDCSKS